MIEFSVSLTNNLGKNASLPFGLEKATFFPLLIHGEKKKLAPRNAPNVGWMVCGWMICEHKTLLHCTHLP
jgi:hypothetical protein